MGPIEWTHITHLLSAGAYRTTGSSSVEPFNAPLWRAGPSGPFTGHAPGCRSNSQVLTVPRCRNNTCGPSPFDRWRNTTCLSHSRRPRCRNNTWTSQHSHPAVETTAGCSPVWTVETTVQPDEPVVHSVGQRWQYRLVRNRRCRNNTCSRARPAVETTAGLTVLRRRNNAGVRRRHGPSKQRPMALRPDRRNNGQAAEPAVHLRGSTGAGTV